MGNDREFAELLQEALHGRLNRREALRRAAALGLAAPAIAALLAACGGDEATQSSGGGSTGSGSGSGGTGGGSAPTATTAAGTIGGTAPAATTAPTAQGEKPVPGGVLKVAIIGEPPSLDMHWGTPTIIGFITWSMYEPLFAWDANYQIIPMLAESHEVSTDKLTHMVRLRKGVPFHNGQEMKANDVEASIRRWATKHALGKALMAATDTINKPDDYTLEFKLKNPFGTFASSLAHYYQGAAIYPQSVIDAAGSDQIKEFIGTGPYKFVERQPDRYIRMERFKDYAALPGDSNGYGGHKYAYVDQIEFTPVPDEAARIAGLKAGDYHYLEAISPDQVEAIQGDATATAAILPPSGWDTLVLNWKSPLMGNQKIRQAFQAALNHDPIMTASRGKGYYRLDPSVMLQETVWHTDAAKELYNRNDPDAAKKLLQEGGYDGTPVRFMTTKEYLYQYNNAVVAKQQIEAVGFKVDLQIFDWATLTTRRTKPEEWDVFTTGISMRPEPTQLAIMQLCNWPGWWCSEDSEALLSQLQSEDVFEKRKEIFAQLQENFYTEVPMIKLGDTNAVEARAKKLMNLSPQSQLGPQLWNAWLKK